jgi:ribosomal protein L37AE/L43A
MIINENEFPEWELMDYVAEPCPNCGRERLCECENGMHRCEKCNWCPELGEYVGD